MINLGLQIVRLLCCVIIKVIGVTTRTCVASLDHPLVSRFVKEIFYKHSPLPNGVETWDIIMVLELFDHMEDKSKFSFKDLTRNIVVFFLILGAKEGSLLLQYKLIVYLMRMINVCFYKLLH